MNNTAVDIQPWVVSDPFWMLESLCRPADYKGPGLDCALSKVLFASARPDSYAAYAPFFLRFWAWVYPKNQQHLTPCTTQEDTARVAAAVQQLSRAIGQELGGMAGRLSGRKR